MAFKRIKRPRDPIALAKLVGDIATGQAEDNTENNKSDAAVARGSKGGKKGGSARAAALTPERRKQIALEAARKRWS